ncbi:MAG: hypothetical protein KA215_03220 [Flavobacterium sp.]|nr:hypothetical protein [Flavobacterium sp.]
MKKISNFETAKINSSSVWGGRQTCWTHTMEVGTTSNPCGDKDDTHYMTNDDVIVSTSSSK